ncbi:MAG TPA: MauE/DoxX family redox-associated membrane protein [Thermoanaerobaculia bacterium]|nr:MauE/DoxX family redox-associated membrane protein [Thermoanaerobaculia bacterium]
MDDGDHTAPTFPPAAGFWRRAFSIGLDLLWLGPGVWVLERTLRGVAPAAWRWAAIAALVLATLAICWRLWGRTPGKALLSLRVVGIDGRRLRTGQVLTRIGGYLLGALTFGLGFVMVGLNASRRGLHDQVAGTYVAIQPVWRRRRASVGGEGGIDSGAPGAGRSFAGSSEGSFEGDGAERGGIPPAAGRFHAGESEPPAMTIETATATTARADAAPRRATAACSPWRWAGLAGAVFLGAVLLVGAYAKALDPLAFVEQIRSEGLDFLLPASWVAALALTLELFLGSALVLGIRRRWVLIPSALLVVFFLFLTGRTYLRSLQGTLEETAGCGCFGNLVERTPAEAFWQDLALLAPALLLAFLAARAAGGFPRARTAIAAAFTAFGLGFAWLAPGLPIDDLATRLQPGTTVADLCTGRDDERICLAVIRPELLEGEHLVVIADLLDPAFGERVGGLNAYRFEVGDVVVLSSATAEEHRQFFWEWGPAFDVVEAPASLLSPLYRTLPRSFVVRDGEVVETFAGLPDLPAAEDPGLQFVQPDEGADDGSAIEETSR